MPLTDELRADCARCAAFCCVATGFERSPDFACSKAPGSRCPHLTDSHRCAIHARRMDLGYAGCVAYDCYGAGQSITSLGGDTRSEMAQRAFRNLAVVHERLAALRLADELELAPSLAPVIRAVAERLETLRRSGLDTLARLDIDAEAQAVEGVWIALRSARTSR